VNISNLLEGQQNRKLGGPSTSADLMTAFTLRWRFVISLFALVLVAACGSDTTSAEGIVGPLPTQQVDELTKPSVDPASELIPLDDTPFAEILRMIPDLPELREQIALEDFSGLSELYGVDRPTSADLDSAGVAFADSLLSAVSSMPGPGRVADAPWISGFHESRDRVDLWNNLGFDQRNVQLSALAGRGNFKLDVLTGNYDLAPTSDAISACEECQPHTLQNYREVEYLGWG